MHVARLGLLARKIAVPLALIFVLGGCGDLPKPFDHTTFGPPPSDLVQLPSGGGVLVRPVTAAPQPFALAAAQGLADALRKRDIPAAVDPRPMEEASPEASSRWSYTVTGFMRDGEVRWEARAPAGTVLTSASRAAPLGTPNWNSEDIARTEGQAVAERLATAIDRDIEQSQDISTPGTTTATLQPQGHAVLLEVQEKGKNGADTPRTSLLREAMATALRQRGVSPLAPTDKAKAMGEKSVPSIVGVFSQSAEVATKDAPGGAVVPISIEWTVRDASGASIGSATQANPVPKTLLETGFAGLAVAIAQAGADGVVGLVDQVQQPKSP